MKYTICPVCSRQISNSNYSKHINAHEKPKRYAGSVDHDGLNCKYCGKLGKNKNSLAQHEIRCPSNLNRLATPGNLLTHPAWNKGLTKDIDIRVAKNADSVKNTLQQNVTEES